MRKLLNKIWIRFTGLVLITLLLSMIIGEIDSVIIENQQIESTIDHEMKSALQLTSKAFSKSLWNYDMEMMNALSEAMFEREVIQCIKIIDQTRGLVLEAHNPLYQSSSPYLLSGQSPIEINNVEIGHVELIITSQFIREELSQKRTRRIIKSILEITSVTLIVLWLSYSVTKPLTKLKNEMSEFAEGDYSKVINIQRSDEVGKLAHAFNSMARQIEATDHALKAFNATLEENVQRRTEQLNESNTALNTALSESHSAQEALARKNEELEVAMEKLEHAYTEILEVRKGNLTSQLISGLTHEINTPLGASLTSITYQKKLINQLKKAYAENSISRQHIERFLETVEETNDIIHNNLNHATSLIEQFKRIAVDQVGQRIREFEVGSYLHELIKNLKYTLKSHAVTVEIICPEPIVINSYPGIFAQTINNLTINSIKHGFKDQQSGTISIQARRINKTLKLVYEDNGKGISGNIIDKIFTPFFSTEHNHGGSGLGLSVIKNLIEVELQGTITCLSQPGKGVQFTIVIPLEHGNKEQL